MAAGGDHGKIGLCLYRLPETVVCGSGNGQGVTRTVMERSGRRLRGYSHSMCCYHQSRRVGGSGGYLDISAEDSIQSLSQ